MERVFYLESFSRRIRSTQVRRDFEDMDRGKNKTSTFFK